MAKPIDRSSRLAAFDAWVESLPNGLRDAMAAHQEGDRDGLARGLYWTKAEPDAEPDGPPSRAVIPPCGWLRAAGLVR